MSGSGKLSQKDIEYEMSRFEEEITKLIPEASKASPYLTAPPQPPQQPPPPPLPSFALQPPAPTPVAAVRPLQRINIQMPVSFSNVYNYATGVGVGMASSTTTAAQQAALIASSAGYHASLAHIPHSVASAAGSQQRPAGAPAGASFTTGTSGGVKRDASGQVIKQQPPYGSGANQQQQQQQQTKPQSSGAESSDASKASGGKQARDGKDKKAKKVVRAAGGQVWEDETLLEWDSDDYRLFVGDLGNEVNDESLCRAFSKYPSFLKAKVVRDKRNGKTKGFGFVSFKNSDDFVKAMREMDGKYVGNRPIKLRKSNWKDRNLDAVKRKESEKQKMGLR